MPSPTPISHYRLATGRIFQNAFTQDIESAIATIERLLVPGRHPLPHTDGWDVETRIAGTTLLATVWSMDRAVLRLWVVVDPGRLALAVPPPRQLDVDLPACIVEDVLDQPFDPSVGWLRDLELALAWAWVREQS